MSNTLAEGVRLSKKGLFILSIMYILSAWVFSPEREWFSLIFWTMLICILPIFILRGLRKSARLPFR